MRGTAANRLVVAVVVMMVHAPYRSRIVAHERIHMDAPVEDSRTEDSTYGIALRPGRHVVNGFTTLGFRPTVFAARWWCAPIHMLVPASQTQRRVRVELVIGRARGCRIHRADEPEAPARVPRI